MWGKLRHAEATWEPPAQRHCTRSLEAHHVLPQRFLTAEALGRAVSLPLSALVWVAGPGWGLTGGHVGVMALAAPSCPLWKAVPGSPPPAPSSQLILISFLQSPQGHQPRYASRLPAVPCACSGLGDAEPSSSELQALSALGQEHRALA